jgi:hypothetical protein
MRNIAVVRQGTEFHSNVKRLNIQQRMLRKQNLRKLVLLWKFLIVVQNLIQMNMFMESS